MEDNAKSSAQSSGLTSLDKSQQAFQKDPQSRANAIMALLLMMSLSVNAVLFTSYKSEVADGKKVRKEGSELVISILLKAVESRNGYLESIDSLKTQSKIVTQ